MRLKVSSAKRWPFCLGHNVLIAYFDQWHRWCTLALNDINSPRRPLWCSTAITEMTNRFDSMTTDFVTDPVGPHSTAESTLL